MAVRRAIPTSYADLMVTDNSEMRPSPGDQTSMEPKLPPSSANSVENEDLIQAAGLTQAAVWPTMNSV
jgi:hypothetical protein